MHYHCHSLDLSCAGCHHPATHTQKHSCIGQGDGHGQVKCKGSRDLMPSGMWVLCWCMYPVLSTATAAGGSTWAPVSCAVRACVPVLCCGGCCVSG